MPPWRRKGLTGDTMVDFCFLNKAEKDIWLPRLFDLLHENMREIAPTGLAYEQEKAQFLANVSPALDRAPRQILMGFVDGELACYVQYYTRGGLLMVEEIQIRKADRGTLLFLRLCRKLAAQLPGDIHWVEAYADRRNRHSLSIMEKLGMVPVPENGASPYVHLRGDAELLKSRFRFGR